MTGNARVPLSVLMLARNARKYLPSAWASLQAQTWGDFEVVVVLDRSTDATQDLLSDFARSDRRLRIVEGPDAGLSAARHAGIAAARADHIALLDSDDTWEPSKLELQIAFLAENPDLVASSTHGWYIGPSGKRLGNHAVGPASRAEFESLRRADRCICLLASGAVFLRSAALKCASPRQSIDAVEDTLLFTRMADLGPIVNLPQPLVSYRVHGSGVSSRLLTRQRLLFRWIEHNLRARRMNEAEIDEEAYERLESRRGWASRIQTGRGDLSAAWYRRAGALLADRSWIAGVPLLFAAMVLDPGYCLRKLVSQFRRRHPTGMA